MQPVHPATIAVRSNQTLTQSTAARRLRRALSGAGVVALVALAVMPVAVVAQDAALNPCGSLRNNYGPFDYRTDRQQLPVVENYHFTPEMEALSPNTKGELGAQFDYTLHAFPNHHRALVAMVRLAERQKTDKPRKAKYPVECYFERGIRFRPDDVIVRMLFVDYLIKHRMHERALGQLAAAAPLAGDSALTHFNLGLLYFSLEKHDHAREHAQRALALGYTRTDLVDKLTARGAWHERPAASPAAPASAP